MPEEKTWILVEQRWAVKIHEATTHLDFDDAKHCEDGSSMCSSPLFVLHHFCHSGLVPRCNLHLQDEEL